MELLCGRRYGPSPPPPRRAGSQETRDRAEGEDREEDEREEADGRGLNGRKAHAERAGEEGVHSAILVGVNICCSACQGSIYRDGLTPGPFAEY